MLTQVYVIEGQPLKPWL